MSLQGPILIVAGRAAAAPVVEAAWPGAVTAFVETRPAAVVVSEPDCDDAEAAAALPRLILEAVPYTPAIVRVREDGVSAVESALPVSIDMSAEQLIARVSSAQRLRTLHSTVLLRAEALKDERNIVAELPQRGPLNDA